MLELIIAIFILGYASIAFEHPLKVNKSGSALLMGILIWTVYRLGWPNIDVAAEMDEFIEHVAPG